MKNPWPILAVAAAGAAYLFKDQIIGFFAPAAAPAAAIPPVATPAPASGPGAGDSTASGANAASDHLFGTDTSSSILPAVTPKLDQIQSSPYLANGNTPAPPATGTAGNTPSQPAQTAATARQRQQARQAQRQAAPKVKIKK